MGFEVKGSWELCLMHNRFLYARILPIRFLRKTSALKMQEVKMGEATPFHLLPKLLFLSSVVDIKTCFLWSPSFYFFLIFTSGQRYYKEMDSSHRDQQKHTTTTKQKGQILARPSAASFVSIQWDSSVRPQLLPYHRWVKEVVTGPLGAPCFLSCSHRSLSQFPVR